MAQGGVEIPVQAMVQILVAQARAVVSDKLTITLVLSGPVPMEIGKEQLVCQATNGNLIDAKTGLARVIEGLENHEGESLIHKPPALAEVAH